VPHPRRIARTLALQSLFLLDNQGDGAMPMVETLLGENAEPGADLPYARTLIRGAWQHRERFDARMDAVATHWSTERMPRVDRMIMRIALFEMLECVDLPHGVAINEAIEIAKQFSTRESAGFVNGILDAIRLDVIRQQQPVPKPRDHDTAAPESGAS
jgi:N utilization substance protein B